MSTRSLQNLETVFVGRQAGRSLAIWGNWRGETAALAYLRKPKWMPQREFDVLLKRIVVMRDENG